MIKLKNLTIKDLTSYLKELILLEIILTVLYMISYFVYDGYFLVPKPIKDFIISYENGINLEASGKDVFLFVFFLLFVFLILYSLIKIWQLKKIGRSIYFFIFSFNTFIAPFVIKYLLLGPLDMILESLFVVISILILLICYVSKLSSNFK